MANNGFDDYTNAALPRKVLADYLFAQDLEIEFLPSCEIPKSVTRKFKT